ncbi:MAG: hypothetical protein GY799_06280, partial [Desulfobulbaceae bacterium]|nr:hypothetical protein [Desulfobulbaceae bacterium]
MMHNQTKSKQITDLKLQALNQHQQEHLTALKNGQTDLQELDLFAMGVTDHALGCLIERLEQLRFLSLADTKITNAGLLHLQDKKELRELHLDNTGITDSGL